MPRPLVFGDGQALVQIDGRGTIRDFCFPVGYWNHLAGRPIRVGVWVEGQFAWCDDPAYWTWEQFYRQGSDELVGGETWHSDQLGLRIEVTDRFRAGAFEREFLVRCLWGEREVFLFVNEQLHIYESDIGDCCLVVPNDGGLMHYKDGTSIVFKTTPYFDSFACGHIGFGHLEGTGRDAEDNHLGGSAIAQGSVDATVRIPLGVVGFSVSVLCKLSIEYSTHREVLLPRVAFYSDDATIRKHVGILSTQIASNGAVLAANDSDIMRTNRANYSYCWPRDAAHVCETLLDCGVVDIPVSFCKWSLPLLDEHPYFYQKYTARGHIGASWHPWMGDGEKYVAFQEDETASVASLYCRALGFVDDDLRAQLLSVLDRCGRLFLDFCGKNGLPLPSYDLWEERLGVHTYTVCTVIRALRDIAGVFDGFEGGFSAELREGADRMVEGLVDVLFLKEEHGFARRLDEFGGVDSTCDASTLHVGLLGVLPLDHPCVVANVHRVERELWVRSAVGGVARYSGDYYFRTSDSYPGNPWIITTLWLAQYYAKIGNCNRAEQLLLLVDKWGGDTGVLGEQVHPDSGETLSVSPLTWSHSEFLRTYLNINRTESKSLD